VKTCSKCKQQKALSDFSPDKHHTDGLRSWCKKCVCDATKKNHAAHPERVKESNKRWRENNVDYNKERIAKWNAENRGHVEEYRKQYRPRRAEIGKEYYRANRDNILEYGKVWRENNIEKTRATGRKAARKRLNTTKGKLNNAMTCGMRGSLKGSKAGRHWEDLVDFTIDQLRTHLEKLFTPEMTWENYGTAWEIDHKIPIAVHNFEKPEDLDFRLCWSLKNLQPLGKAKNRSKRDKIDKPFQPSLAIAV